MPHDDTLTARDFGVRAFALEDVTVRADGDGRTVEAYAAVFNTRTEIRDQDGHYLEQLAPGAFATTIATRGTNFGVFYNHARSIYGTPDGALSVPIGTPLEVREDERGVFTVTRYLDNPLADSVLDAIKQRAIRGQSFSGRFRASARAKATERGGLPTITRTEVEMREYGPTVFPAYTEAAILGHRSVSAFLDELAALGPDELARVRSMLGLATPLGPDGSTGTSAEVAPTGSGPTVSSHPDRTTPTFSSLRWSARERGVLS